MTIFEQLVFAVQVLPEITQSIGVAHGHSGIGKLRTLADNAASAVRRYHSSPAKT